MNKGLVFFGVMNLVVSMLVLAACGSRERTVVMRPDKDYQVAAQEIAASLNNRRSDVINKYLDMHLVIEAATRDFGFSQEDIDQMASRIGPDVDVGKMTLASFTKGCKVTLLHVYRINGEPHALFRVASPRGALAYEDFWFGEARDEQSVAIIDIYFFETGLSIVDQYRAMIERSLGGSQLKRLLVEKDMTGLDSYITEMTKAAKSVTIGDTVAALKALESIPESYKHDRLPMAMKLQLLVRDRQRFLSLATEYKAVFPHDPAVYLFEGQYYRNMNNRKASLASTNALDSALGGDPYLDYYRARDLFALNDIPAALSALHRVLATVPDHDAPHWLLIEFKILNHLYAEATPLLTKYCRQFNLDKNSVDKQLTDHVSSKARPDQFRQSPEYRAWLTSPIL